MKNNSRSRLLDNWPAKTIALIAAMVLYLFNHYSKLDSRIISVPLSVISNTDVVAASQIAKTVRVKIRGEPPLVSAIDPENIHATVDLARMRKPGTVTVPVTINRSDSDTAALEGDVEISPDPSSLTVVLETRIEKQLPLEPKFLGFLAPGFEFASYSLNPEQVRVSGPESLVNSLEELPTEPIELGNKDADFVVRTRIDLETPLVNIEVSRDVVFKATIQKSPIPTTIDSIPIIARNMHPGLKLASTLPSGRLSLFSSNIASENVAHFLLILDFSQITEPGEYELPVIVDLPQGMIAQDYSPRTVTVHVTIAQAKRP